MKPLTLLTGIILATTSAAWAASENAVEYKEGTTALEGFVAYPDALTAATPVVVIVHDWMGLGDFYKDRARAIAKLGYIGFSADIYGKGVHPGSMNEAGILATKYKENRPLLRKRILAAVDAAKKLNQADSKRMAIMGYCFGGTTALEAGRAGAPVLGIVSFHGGLSSPTPADAKNIKGKVLVLHGANDPLVPAEEVAAFQQEMKNADVDWELTYYSGAVHAFTNPNVPYKPGAPFGYNQSAADRSWIAMKDFLGEIFKR